MLTSLIEFSRKYISHSPKISNTLAHENPSLIIYPKILFSPDKFYNATFGHTKNLIENIKQNQFSSPETFVLDGMFSELSLFKILNEAAQGSCQLCYPVQNT